MRKWRMWLVGGLASLLMGCGATGASVGAPVAPRPVALGYEPSLAAGVVQVGESVPHLQFTRTGVVTTVADLQGKVVLLNFWATTCTPCRQELPMLQGLVDDRADIAVIGINWGEAATVVEPFVQTGGWTFPMVVDPTGGLAQRFTVHFLPTTYVIGPDGTLRQILIGEQSRTMMEAAIKAAQVPEAR